MNGKIKKKKKAKNKTPLTLKKCSSSTVFKTMMMVEQIVCPHEIPGQLNNAYFIVYDEDISSVLECGCVTLCARLVITPMVMECWSWIIDILGLVCSSKLYVPF